MTENVWMVPGSAATQDERLKPIFSENTSTQEDSRGRPFPETLRILSSKLSLNPKDRSLSHAGFVQPVKPGWLVSVSVPLTGVALVCEALSGVLRVGVVSTGAVPVGGGVVCGKAVAL